MLEFQNPEQLLADPALTVDEKLRVLREWEYDQLEIAAAQNEGMQGPDPEWLAIRRALAELEAGLRLGATGSGRG